MPARSSSAREQSGCGMEGVIPVNPPRASPAFDEIFLLCLDDADHFILCRESMDFESLAVASLSIMELMVSAAHDQAPEYRPGHPFRIKPDKD